MGQNTHDLKLLTATAVEPIEVLEAHFGVGVMDFEALEFTAAHNIHPVAFASRSVILCHQCVTNAVLMSIMLS